MSALKLWKQVLIIPIIILITLALLICYLIMTTFIRDALVNSYLLHQLDNKLQTVPNPDNSVLIRHVSGTGTTGGSAGWVILFAGELRRYPGNRADIEAFYHDKGVSLRFVENEGQLTEPKNWPLDMLPVEYEDYDGFLGKRWQFTMQPTNDVVYIIFLGELRT